MKRRILKYLVIGLVAIVLAGFWGFSTFFFNPFEGQYEYDLSTLIPRNVDFYFSKARIRDDFDPLPRPAFADDFLASANGQAVLEMEGVSGLLESLEIEAALAPLEEGLADLPIDADVLAIFGGADLAVAGTFKGAELADADWAAYGRANWMGKLAVEVIASGLMDLSAQGLAVTELTQGFSISGGELPRTLYITRILDVIVVATTQDLMDQAKLYDSTRGEDSFGQSAKYFDHIANVGTEGNELEAYVDYRALSENMKLPGSWPDPHAERLGIAMGGKLFQAGAIRELLGSFAFGNGLTFHLTGLMSSELMSSFQKKFYRQQGFDKEELSELAKMAPGDAGLFFAMRGPLGDILRQLLESLEESAVTNLEDVVRDVWGYADAHPLIEDLDSAFKDRFAFFLRNHDYPADSSEFAPIPNDVPVPAWALALVVDDQDTLEQIRARILAGQSALGIRGRQPGSRGVFDNTVAGGGKVFEYHNPLVPGTGHIATIEVPGRGDKFFVISNSSELLGQMFKTYNRDDLLGLSDDGWFQTLVNTGLPSADVLLWVNPRAVSDTTREVARFNAELDILDAVDWEIERPRIEKKVLKENFPGERWGAVSPDNQDAFEMLVDQEVDRFQTEFNSLQLPALRAKYERRIDAWELVSGALVELAIDQKRFHLYGRVVVPLDRPE